MYQDLHHPILTYDIPITTVHVDSVRPHSPINIIKVLVPRAGVAPPTEAAVVVIVETAAVRVALDHLTHLQQCPFGPPRLVGRQTATYTNCSTTTRQGENGDEEMEEEEEEEEGERETGRERGSVGGGRGGEEEEGRGGGKKKRVGGGWGCKFVL